MISLFLVRRLMVGYVAKLAIELLNHKVELGHDAGSINHFIIYSINKFTMPCVSGI